MKKLTTLLILTLTASRASFGQIVPDGSKTPQQLVTDYLVGPGITVSGVTFNGMPGTLLNSQIGFFSGSSSIGLDSGVVIASGHINNIAGPNNTSSVASSYGIPSFDPDILAICAAGDAYDQGVLEFDFVPTGDTVKFSFVFGSDEYMEYAGSPASPGVNDAFGIFLSGPGISGPYSMSSVNMATLPGGMPVSIDNVNMFVNPTYYVDNGDGFTPPYSTNPYYIQYDGFTVKLTAKWPVTCGMTYHVKFAIADAADDWIDSGVFIEAGSFSSAGASVSVNVPAVAGAGPNAVFEGCDLGSSADFTFTRPDSAGTDTLFFTIGGDAVNGADYSLISPSYVIFAPGQTSATITVNVFDDGITEGVDTLTITTDPTSTPCGLSSGVGVTLYIHDPYTLLPFAGNDTVYYCLGQTISFYGTSMNGNAPFDFAWSDGTVGAPINYTITTPGSDSLILTVTDGCGYSGTDTVYMVQVPSPTPLVADAGPDINITCPGQTIFFNGTYTGGTGTETFSWYSSSMGTILGNPVANTPLVTEYYVFTVMNSCGQIDHDSVHVTVAPYTPLTLSLTDDTLEVTCAGMPASITATAGGGTAPYTYSWSNGDTDSTTSVNIFANGILTLMVSDACGLDTVVEIPLEVTGGNINLDFPDGRYCRNSDSTAAVPLTVTGGMAPYTFTWTTQPGGTVDADSVNLVLNITNPVTGYYNLTVTDACGSTHTDSGQVIMQDCDLDIPNVMTPNGDGVNDYFVIGGLAAHPNSILKVFNRWGSLIFIDTDYTNDWNGTGLAAGVYFYIIQLTDGTVPSEYHGFLNIFY